MNPKLPHPKFYDASFKRQVDPNEVMENFYELAKCATALGYENFNRLSGGISLTKFERQRSVFTVHFAFPDYSPYPADCCILIAPYDLNILSITVGRASCPADSGAPSAFTATVKRNKTALGTIAPPTGVEKNYVFKGLYGKQILATETLKIAVVSGTVDHLTFEFSYSLINYSVDR